MPPSPIISVRNIGKKYKLGATLGGRNYKTLRDVLTQAAFSPFRKLSAAFRKKPFTGGSHSSPNNPIIQSPNNPNEFWALKNITFDVQQGEVVGIIGRNGAGKSTLLKILSEITEPTEGEIRIRGRVASLLEVGTGFHSELSGRENIYLNGAILGMTRGEIKRKFDEIVAFAETEKFLDTPVKRYSSGMYVRLAFAVAAHLEPEILVVDEVLAVGDAAFQKKCLGKMGEVAREGRTVLFVSHNMAAIQVLCQRAIVLNRGKCIWDTTAREAVSLYMASATESVQASYFKGTEPGSIREVYFCNDRGERASTVVVGMSLDICINYSLPKQASGLGFSVVFRGNLGEPVTCCHSISVRGPMSNDYNDGIAICHIPKLSLMPGEYLLDISLDQRGDLVEIRHQALRVIVEQGDYYGSGRIPPVGYGSLLMEQSWSSKPVS